MNPVDLALAAQDHGARGGNANVTRLVALVADLDLGGKLTEETIPEVVSTLTTMIGTQPIAATFTGHGVQVFFAVEQTADADLSDPARRADAMAVLSRFGRLVKRVARNHGGTADSVFDLARVARVPGTINFKDSRQPVPVLTLPTGGGWRPVSLEELRDTLDALAVPEYDEDREVLGAVVSDPHGWGWAKHPCGYVSKMINGWSTDRWEARHPSLVGRATRLAAARAGFGCVTEAKHQRGVQVLADEMHRRCATQEPRRAVGQTEIEDALGWGVDQVSRMSDERVAVELGHHRRRRRCRCPRRHPGRRP